MRHLVLAIASILAAACGRHSNDKADTAADPREGWPLAMATMAERPPCDATREGLLVYVASDRGFFVCTASAWYAVNLRGPEGEPGAPGKAGTAGMSGYNGERGPAGETGATGAKGDTGEQGDQGEQGETGDVGPQGVQGERGEKGDPA